MDNQKKECCNDSSINDRNKMSPSWELLDKKNYELSTLIKTQDIAAPSSLHDNIRDNVALMYQKYNTSPSYYIPGDQYWDEYAQLSIGSDPPPHLDPHNIAYYHYRKLQDDELLQRERCNDSSSDNRNNNDDDVCEDDEDDDAGFVDGSSDNSDDGKENSTNMNNSNEDDNDDYERVTFVVVKR
uniref:Uncharacterized protein n=1 Tax=Penaeus semisulcatus majanivirus TaxID=2984274 RepID=A0A9C7BVP4_9VIRU|nr:MAG: hypothetical protein [Penaeus semisulcatus majanivirus]